MYNQPVWRLQLSPIYVLSIARITAQAERCNLFKVISRCTCRRRRGSLLRLHKRLVFKDADNKKHGHSQKNQCCFNFHTQIMTQRQPLDHNISITKESKALCGTLTALICMAACVQIQNKPGQRAKMHVRDFIFVR